MTGPVSVGESRTVILRSRVPARTVRLACRLRATGCQTRLSTGGGAAGPRRSSLSRCVRIGPVWRSGVISGRRQPRTARPSASRAETAAAVHGTGQGGQGRRRRPSVSVARSRVRQVCARQSSLQQGCVQVLAGDGRTQPVQVPVVKSASGAPPACRRYARRRGRCRARGWPGWGARACLGWCAGAGNAALCASAGPAPFE